MTEPLTSGVHHVGLSVPDLEAAERFFLDALGWAAVGGVDSYPARFVSDGATMLTLWRVAEPAAAAPFDRRGNVGLHHLALLVRDGVTLAAVHDRVRAHPGVTIEFAPQPMGKDHPLRHFICAMPGGVRLEFTCRASAEAGA